MADEREQRVNAKVEQLNKYKDEKGIPREQSLSQKERDLALHGEITGNQPTRVPVEQPPKKDMKQVAANRTMAEKSRPILEQIETLGGKMGILDQLRDYGKQATSGVGGQVAPPEPQLGPLIENAPVAQPKAGPQLPLADALQREFANQGITGVNVTTEPGNAGAAIANMASNAPATNQDVINQATGGQVELPPQYKQPSQRGGLFSTEPPDVTPAKEIEEPGMGKTLLAGLGAFIPGVGGLLMEPYAKAQRQYLKKTEKDKQLTTMFWKELAENPQSAKSFARVPIVRDALQRSYGMTAQEIIDLDKSITPETGLSLQKAFELAEKGGFEPAEEMIEMAGQQFQRKPRTLTVGDEVLMFNPVSQKYEPNYSEKKKLYEDAKSAYTDLGYSPAEATIAAQGALKGIKMWDNISVGNGVVVFKNNATGKTEKLVVDEAVKKNIKMEVLKRPSKLNPLVQEPYGFFFYDVNRMPQSTNDIQVVNLDSVKDINGNPMTDMLTQMLEENPDDPGYFSRAVSWLSGMFGGVEATDYSTYGEPNGASSPGAQPRAGQGQGQPQGAPAPAPVTPPPAAGTPSARAGQEENKRVQNLLKVAGGAK